MIDALYDYARAIGYSQRMLNALRQDEVWTTREGETLALEDLEDSHRRHLLRWLERRAESLKHCADFELVLDANGPIGEAARDCLDAEQDAMLDMSALEWLNECPLVRRLRALEARRGW